MFFNARGLFKGFRPNCYMNAFISSCRYGRIESKEN